MQRLAASPALMLAASLLVLLLADTVYLAISSYFYPLALPANYSSKIFLLNLLPIVIVSLMWWLLTARVLVSFILTATLFDAVFLANKMKMVNLGQPSIIVDYVSAFNMVGHSNLLANYFTSWWHPGILITLLILAVVLMFFEKPSFKLKPVWRPLLLVMLLLLLGQTGAAGIRQIYQPGETWRAWQAGNNLHNFGLLYSLTHDTGQLASGRRDFDKERVEAIIQQPAKRLFDSSDDLPEVENIIVVLSESFFDPSDLNGVESAQYDVPGYSELLQRSLSGRIKVPTYGGATVRTEFELLTGVDLDMFPVHRYPLVTLVISPINSIAWDVRRAGYSALGIHPNVASFWSRDTAYPYLGFEEFLDFDLFKRSKRSGYYVADAELTKKLKEQIEDNKKQFIFAISMENHGPWKTGRTNLNQDMVDLIEAPPQLDGENRVAFQQFIYHMQAAEVALLDLIEDLDSRKETMDSRAVVMFFGDHLPGLTGPFDALGFKNGKAAFEQTTPYLIYDTHRDLSGLDVSNKAVIDVTLLGSLLMDISLGDLPDFHSHAERLQLNAQSAQNTKTDDELTDLQELQLWRFWQTPLDSNGEKFRVGEKKPVELAKVVKLEPLDCIIEQWGPKKTYVGEGFNIQPNGQSALYVKTDCADQPLDIRIDGENMWTTKDEDVLSTMMIVDDLVAESGRHTVELYDRTTGRSQPLGVFRVKRRWLPE
jgi:phosphoglycerol transferase MdoB-like AlkP superfamily enzyme